MVFNNNKKLQCKDWRETMGKVKDMLLDEVENTWGTISEMIRNSDNVEQLQTGIDYAVRESRTNPMLGLPSMIPDQVTELWNEIHND